MADRFAEFAQKNYARQVGRLVDALRASADAVERSTVRPKASGGDGKPDHTWHAQQVIHEILGAVGALTLDSLVEAAAEADRAVREEDA